MENVITDDDLRKAYEPCYRRRLSDDEVREIRTNLMAFAGTVLKVVQERHAITGLPDEKRRDMYSI